MRNTGDMRVVWVACKFELQHGNDNLKCTQSSRNGCCRLSTCRHCSAFSLFLAHSLALSIALSYLPNNAFLQHNFSWVIVIAGAESWSRKKCNNDRNADVTFRFTSIRSWQLTFRTHCTAHLSSFVFISSNFFENHANCWTLHKSRQVLNTFDLTEADKFEHYNNLHYINVVHLWCALNQVS